MPNGERRSSESGESRSELMLFVKHGFIPAKNYL